jgi:hypothetical protein
LEGSSHCTGSLIRQRLRDQFEPVGKRMHSAPKNAGADLKADTNAAGLGVDVDGGKGVDALSHKVEVQDISVSMRSRCSLGLIQ